MDLAPGERFAIRLAYERLGPLGTESGTRLTGRSTLDIASLGVLLLF